MNSRQVFIDSNEIGTWLRQWGFFQDSPILSYSELWDLDWFLVLSEGLEHILDAFKIDSSWKDLQDMLRIIFLLENSDGIHLRDLRSSTAKFESSGIHSVPFYLIPFITYRKGFIQDSSNIPSEQFLIKDFQDSI